MKTNTKERLMELSLTQKNNLKSILKRREMSNEKKLKEQNEKKLFKLNNNTYKPYVKDNKRKWVDRLYEKGINSIKQKEEIIRNQKIKLDNEYLKYSYSPLLNSNYTYTNFYKTKILLKILQLQQTEIIPILNQKIKIVYQNLKQVCMIEIKNGKI